MNEKQKIYSQIGVTENWKEAISEGVRYLKGRNFHKTKLYVFSNKNSKTFLEIRK